MKILLIESCSVCPYRQQELCYRVCPPKIVENTIPDYCPLPDSDLVESETHIVETCPKCGYSSLSSEGYDILKLTRILREQIMQSCSNIKQIPLSLHEARSIVNALLWFLEDFAGIDHTTEHPEQVKLPSSDLDKVREYCQKEIDRDDFEQSYESRTDLIMWADVIRCIDNL
jgi:hypothetical protein